MLYIGKVSRYLEGECYREFRKWKFELSLSYTTVREFLSDLKKEFGREDDKIIKIVELKKIEQRSKMIEKLFKNLEEQQKEVDMRDSY